MLKIQNVGIGNFIRNPKGVRQPDSPEMRIIEVLQVAANNGGSFLCYPVTDPKTVPATVDTKRYYDIPIDTMVDQVTV